MLGTTVASPFPAEEIPATAQREASILDLFHLPALETA
jgi:hypothetical protein